MNMHVMLSSSHIPSGYCSENCVCMICPTRAALVSSFKPACISAVKTDSVERSQSDVSTFVCSMCTLMHVLRLARMLAFSSALIFLQVETRKIFLVTFSGKLSARSRRRVLIQGVLP